MTSDFEDYLIERTDLEPAVISEIFKNNSDTNRIAKILIDRYGIKKEILGRIWGDYLGFAYVEPNNSIVKKVLIEKLGEDFILENKVLPLYKFGRAVTVCASDPKNPYLQDKIEKALGEIVSLVFCFPSDIEEYIAKNRTK
jgi:hypothetical protein